MAFRTRRQARYLRLRNSFFLPFEARPLSKIPTKICPYLRAMIKERKEMARKAQAQGKTLTQFADQIKELYRINKWLKLNRAGKIVADPWKMLRDFEDKWKSKNPQYTSPWMKKWKQWRDFQRMIEPTLRKQRGIA